MAVAEFACRWLSSTAAANALSGAVLFELNIRNDRLGAG